jgi:hypothetical protein
MSQNRLEMRELGRKGKRFQGYARQHSVPLLRSKPQMDSPRRGLQAASS